MEKVAEYAALRAQRRAIGSQAVDHHAPGLELLDDLLDLVEMRIDLELLSCPRPSLHIAFEPPRESLAALGIHPPQDTGGVVLDRISERPEDDVCLLARHAGS